MTNRKDTAAVKRVELSLHTEYAKMDSTASIRSAVNQAVEWGHSVIAVTDHGTAQAFPDACYYSQKYGMKVIYGLDAYYINDVDGTQSDKMYHLTLLVKNRIGLKNLYELISKSYLSFFGKYPCICKSMLLNYKDGLIVGSAGEDGEIFDCIKNANLLNAEKLASLYDYLEVRPVCAGKQPLNLQIAELASRINKPVVATGNVHYLNPKDRIARDVLLFARGITQADDVDLHFRTTDEMMEEFAYLGRYCTDAVITNPLKIADKCESIELFKPGMYRPSIDNSKEDLKRLCINKVKGLYGEQIPQPVQDRLDWELMHILKNNFDFEYMLAYRLVSRAKEQGLPTMTRAGACASFVAYLLGISKINPMAAHYRCPKCLYTRFADTVSNGNDLPDMICPNCGLVMKKNGYNIPAEVFLGLDGERCPDIDPVFSSKYYKNAENCLKEMFGHNHVFRGGQVLSLSSRASAYYLKKYCEENHLKISEEEKYRIVDLLVGVKRNDSCIPGKYVILHPDKEITDFCPSQWNNRRDHSFMAQFELNKLDIRLYTQDVFENSALSILEELEKLTNVKVYDIPMNDPIVFQMIADEKFSNEFFEFGEWKKQNLLRLCKPNTFAELIKVSGIAHGTGVWKNNGELLLKNGTAGLDELVTHRDDIFLYLIDRGVPREEAYRLMEATRKGRIKSGIIRNHREVLNEYSVPEWFVESLEKIDYLFPKAHSAEYVTLAFRLAWYKVHYEEEYAKAKRLCSKIHSVFALTN